MQGKSPSISNWSIAAITLACGAVLCVLVILHTPYLNGPWYWKWQYLVPPHDALRWYGLMGLCSLPIALSLLLLERFRISGDELGLGKVCLLLALLMAGSGAMKLMSSALQLSPPSLDGAGYIMSSPVKTSYYFDAGVLMKQRDWMARYHEYLPITNLHTQSKPPGPVLYSALMIRLFGSDPRAATIAAIVLGVLSLLAIPSVYWLGRSVFLDQWASFIAAMAIAVAPGFVYMFPAFDPVWIAFAATMLGAWRVAIDDESNVWAIVFGLSLAVATLFTYLVLVLGAFIVLYALLSGNELPIRERITRVIKLSVISIGLVIGFYVALAVTTGFDPIATFRAAYDNQARLLVMHSQDRPYPWTILFDLTDFMLGFGWIAIIPAVYALVRSRGHERLVFALFIAMPLIVAVTGLIQSETARCWLFMTPLVLIPAAWTISAWTRWMRITSLVLMLAIALVVGQHMMFKWPTEDVVRNALRQQEVAPAVMSASW